MKKKEISKKPFKVLGQKVEKKKAKYFCRKKFGKKNVLEFFPKKTFLGAAE